MILNTKEVILASTSRYRRELLARLAIPFAAIAPDVEEGALARESPPETARRLARAKAAAVATGRTGALVIGSDQVAALGHQVLDKPLVHARAVEQLRAMRGREVLFHTGLCVIDTDSGKVREDLVTYTVRLRNYDDETIERYLQAERPYDCAGSAKSEGMGIVLIEWMRGDDPTALVGLPLIALTGMLLDAGMRLPAAPPARTG